MTIDMTTPAVNVECALKTTALAVFWIYDNSVHILFVHEDVAKLNCGWAGPQVGWIRIMIHSEY